ncbi:MAG: hypothetical protein A2010_19315 [Nitrospirae bacterium GWD2_57_9]|nr:MAG: hypothetical protein A2010_19315 [Nitrospirae bacterium GWD2_57_9]
MNSPTDKDRVIDTVIRLFINTDNRDWKKVKALFTESVFFDMQSVSGARASILTPREIVDGWEKGLKPLKAIHHQAGNFQVEIEDNEATVFCYGIAWHYLPNPSGRNTRTFVGSYDMRLLNQFGEWKIDRFKYNLKFIDGNADLEQRAAEKAA